jgi:hypothetical protein
MTADISWRSLATVPSWIAHNYYMMPWALDSDIDVREVRRFPHTKLEFVGQFVSLADDRNLR